MSRGKTLELLRPDDSGRLQTVYTVEMFACIRSLAPFRLTGATRDFLIVGSDSGRIVILEYVKEQGHFRKVHQETFGKSGCRRIVPGQFLAVDPKGRACMIGAHAPRTRCAPAWLSEGAREVFGRFAAARRSAGPDRRPRGPRSARSASAPSHRLARTAGLAVRGRRRAASRAVPLCGERLTPGGQVPEARRGVLGRRQRDAAPEQLCLTVSRRGLAARRRLSPAGRFGCRAWSANFCQRPKGVCGRPRSRGGEAEDGVRAEPRRGRQPDHLVAAGGAQVAHARLLGRRPGHGV